MSDWFELAVILFIVLGIGAATYFRGKANPDDTGVLGGQIAALGAQVGKFEVQLDDIEKDVRRLDDDAASKADIKRLERAVTGLQGEVAGLATSAASREATLDHVKQSVDRLLDIIVKRGL